MKYEKLILWIFGITLLISAPIFLFGHFLKVELFVLCVYSIIVIGESILLGMLIFYWKGNESEKRTVLDFSNNFLHKYWKGRIATAILLLLYSTTFVLLGLYSALYLQKHGISEVIVAAFSGAIVGSLFSSLVELMIKTIDHWEMMTPKLFLRRYNFFVIIGLLTWIIGPLALLYL